jgi:hypothetical protein
MRQRTACAVSRSVCADGIASAAPHVPELSASASSSGGAMSSSADWSGPPSTTPVGGASPAPGVTTPSDGSFVATIGVPTSERPASWTGALSSPPHDASSSAHTIVGASMQRPMWILLMTRRAPVRGR